MKRSKLDFRHLEEHDVLRGVKESVFEAAGAGEARKIPIRSYAGLRL